MRLLSVIYLSNYLYLHLQNSKAIFAFFCRTMVGVVSLQHARSTRPHLIHRVLAMRVMLETEFRVQEMSLRYRSHVFEREMLYFFATLKIVISELK